MRGFRILAAASIVATNMLRIIGQLVLITRLYGFAQIASAPPENKLLKSELLKAKDEIKVLEEQVRNLQSRLLLECTTTCDDIRLLIYHHSNRIDYRPSKVYNLW